MAYFIEYRDADGKSTFVEAEGTLPSVVGDDPIKASVGDGGPSRTVAVAQITFEQALETVKPSIAGFIKLVDGLEHKLETVELTLGLKVTGELGVFSIAKASGEANYTLKLSWKPREA